MARTDTVRDTGVRSDADASEAVVEVSGLGKVYPRTDGDVAALAEISLTFSRGSATAITGPSGSGKSSLLLLIAGLDRPSSGSISVMGQCLDSMGEEELADIRRRHIGFVFQNYHLIPTLTVWENVMLPLAPMEGMGLNPRTRALQHIERVGLEGRIDHLPAELSGGEQQRVALARALINDPSIILADEPTGNLDADAAANVLELLFEFARESGKTVILTSHSREAAELCDRQVRIVAGRLVS